MRFQSPIFIEKLTKVVFVVSSGVYFMTPPLYNLHEKYPKVIILKIVEMALQSVTILLLIIFFFSCWKNGHFRNENKEKPKRCSKMICSSCAARRRNPKWFQLKYLLLTLLLFAFGLYPLIKIQGFFEIDQSINLYRLSQLFGWQVSWISSAVLLSFFCNELSLHSGPVEEDGYVNEKEAIFKSTTGQQV
ncbi:uncharacterized protein SPAR_L00920 [Saccharomyces paradoxus]|uniref:Uncharacterized protein n=1 Tax=Saccharomyces paradoxus TaxID=27291 RepID=A0A8B8UVR5_SACPA|nr:uncharacterized protein SPAR_L00920 [Saccharomyces paradoxus]QHS74781.1 hypothetical protein SPAR_L00920 [Saccharomyces paradoxus]